MRDSFLHYTVMLFIVTGALLLAVEAKIYKKAQLRKETISALFAGWLQIVLGLAIYLGAWIYTRWLW